MIQKEIQHGVNDLSTRQGAKIAGFGLLGMFLAGIFASGPEISVTFDDIPAMQSRLRINLIGDVFMLIFDVIAALGLYVLLRSVNKHLSLLSSWFRLIHVAIYGSVIMYLPEIVRSLNDLDEMAVAQGAVVMSQLMTFVRLHEYGFLTGLLFFGIHFMFLGYLILRSGYIPKLLGVLLLLVSVGYLANSLSAFLLPNYDAFKVRIQQIVFLPAIIAELSLCLWLLLKGKSIPEIQVVK